MHRFKLKRWLTIGMSAAFAIGISGCSEESSVNSSTTPTTTAAAEYTGVLFDGPVSGVNYSTPSHQNKVTDEYGRFNYADGEDVVFEFGNAKLGDARGKGKVTPMDIINADTDDERVQMMASLLQSLDEDGDQSNGIKLTKAKADLLNAELAGTDYSNLKNAEGKIDFEALDTANLTDAKTELEALLIKVAGPNYVNLVTATENLIASTDSVIFRKNISKTPDLASAKAKLNIMTVYVPTTKADGTVLSEKDVDGKCLVGQLIPSKANTVCYTKPVITAYVDVDKRTPTAGADAFLAISRDDGSSWKRFNISRTGDKDVTAGENASNADSFPSGWKGESKKPVFQVKGNKVLVSWTDKYCKGGQPRYAALAETDVNGDGVVNEKDKLYPDYYGVAGHQGFIDYTKDPVPPIDPDRLLVVEKKLGGLVVPYSCVWSARATIKPWKGDIQLYKAERLTSGTRDAYQIFVGGAGGAGLGIVWQEDPKGLRPGSGDGPGDGMSGATINHKTDVWYNYVKWADFDAIDTEDVPGSLDPAADPDLLGDPVDVTGENARVRALNHMSMPLRLTDNNMCNLDNIATNGHEYCRLGADGNLVTWEGWDNVVDAVSKPFTPTADAFSNMVNCASMKEVPSAAGTQTVCVTKAGSVLDGDTGASRPNLMMQPYTNSQGVTSAYAVIGYEETKGVGGGPETDPEDIGKDVRYHSFDFSKPEQVAAGGIVNLPELDANKDPMIIENPDGTARYATENARRVRFIIQGKKPSLGSTGDNGAGVPLLVIYKQGQHGKGRPSDIMIRRLNVWTDPNCTPGTCVAKKGNPYAYSNFLCDTALPEKEHTFVLDGFQYTSTLPETCNAKGVNGVQNMSTMTPTLILPPQSGEDEVESDDGTKVVYDKLMTWTVTEADLLKESWETPMTESRAHRGQIRGDFVAIGYTQTPNWAAARKGHDKYDYYVRRSFNGGKTCTTLPASKGGVGTTGCKWERTDLSVEAILVCNTTGPDLFEQPRNLSLLKNAKESVIEPRLVAVPGTINACDGAPCVPEDKQNKWVILTAYGTATNEDPDNSVPADMFYARTTNFGESFSTVPHNSWLDSDGNPAQVFDWLAKRDNVQEGEAQVRQTPAGTKGYVSYLSESGDGYDGPDHFSGSDIWFRKLGEADFNPEEETTAEEP